MIKFDVKDGKLTIKTSILLVKEFLDIWEDDKSPNKAEAIKDFIFIYTLCDTSDDNPFKDMAYDTVEDHCKRNAYGKVDYTLSPDRLIKINCAIIMYQDLNETSDKRLLKVLDKKIDELRKYLDDNPIDGTNAEMMFRLMEKSDKPMIAKRNAQDIIEKGIKSAKTRGSVSQSPNEKGMLNYDKR